MITGTGRAWPGAVLGVAVCLGAGLSIGSPLLASAGPLVVVVVVGERRRRRDERHRRRSAQARLGGVDRLIQELRAGSSLHESCRRLPPSGFEPLIVALASGQRLEAAAQALLDGQSRSGTSTANDERLLAVTLQALAVRGGRAGPPLERLRRALQAGIDRQHRMEAQAAQALNSAALLALAPLGFGLMAAMVDPAVARVYRYELLGALCGSGAVALAALGWWWMRGLINGSADGAASATSVRAARTVGRQSRRRAPTAELGALAATVDLSAIVVRAGGTVYQAIDVVAEQGPPAARCVFGRIRSERAQGSLLRDAIASVGGEADHQAFRPILDALWLAQAQGAPLGALLDRLSDDIEQRSRAQAEASVGRLSVALVPPLVVCFLPAMIIGSIVPLAATALRTLRTA